MCIVCERELWGEHRDLEREFFKPCKECNKFPGTSSDGTCYHCFAVGNTIDECPECAGKPWSEEFLEAKNEIEGPDELLVPSSSEPVRHCRASFAAFAATQDTVGVNKGRGENLDGLLLGWSYAAACCLYAGVKTSVAKAS